MQAGQVHLIRLDGGLQVVLRNVPTPGQPRQNRNTRWGNGRNAERAQEYNAWRAGLRDALVFRFNEIGAARLGGMIEATLTYEMRLPPNQVGPDLDSLIKSTLDAARGILFGDDRYIASIVAEKWAGPKEECVWTFRQVRSA